MRFRHSFNKDTVINLIQQKKNFGIETVIPYVSKPYYLGPSNLVDLACGKGYWKAYNYLLNLNKSGARNCLIPTLYSTCGKFALVRNIYSGFHEKDFWIPVEMLSNRGWIHMCLFKQVECWGNQKYINNGIFNTKHR